MPYVVYLENMGLWEEVTHPSSSELAGRERERGQRRLFEKEKSPDKFPLPSSSLHSQIYFFSSFLVYLNFSFVDRNTSLRDGDTSHLSLRAMRLRAKE